MLVAAAERHRAEDEARAKMEDLRAGKIVAATYNAAGVGKKAWKPSDFFPSLVPVRAGVQPGAAILAAVEAANAAMGGKDLRKRAG